MTVVPPPPPARQAFPDPIPEIIPFGSICTLAGASGVGKNALISEWVARWLSGRSICGRPTNCPAQIAMIAGDRRWRSHRQWLDVAGCPDIPHYSLRDDALFTWGSLRITGQVPLVLGRILDKLDLLPGSMVILDPMALFIPGRVNDYKDVAIGLGTLDQLLKPRQLTALGIFHQAKQTNDAAKRYTRPQDRILGSAAQLGFSDTPMYLLSPEDLDEPYYGLGWVPHHAPADTFKFSRTPTGLFVPYVGASDSGTTPETDRPTQVLAFLPVDGSLERHLWHAYAKAVLDLPLATFKRDIQTLLDRGLVVKDGRGKYSRRKLQ